MVGMKPSAAEFHQVVDLVQYPARPLHDLGPDRGQHDLLVAALDELYPKKLLKLLDLRAQSRLTDEAGFGRPAEMSQLGHRDQVA